MGKLKICGWHLQTVQKLPLTRPREHTSFQKERMEAKKLQGWGRLMCFFCHTGLLWMQTQSTISVSLRRLFPLSATLFMNVRVSRTVACQSSPCFLSTIRILNYWNCCSQSHQKTEDTVINSRQNVRGVGTLNTPHSHFPDVCQTGWGRFLKLLCTNRRSGVDLSFPLVLTKF